MDFESIDKDLISEDFRGMFRMTRAQFYLLLSQVTPFIEKDFSMGWRSKRIFIPLDTRLAMTLRYLAGEINGSLSVLTVSAVARFKTLSTTHCLF